MTTEQLTELQSTIKRVLDDWQDTQLNIRSDSARLLLALAIAEAIDD